MDKETLELYSDYLISSFNLKTAVKLAPANKNQHKLDKQNEVMLSD